MLEIDSHEFYLALLPTSHTFFFIMAIASYKVSLLVFELVGTDTCKEL